MPLWTCDFESSRDAERHELKKLIKTINTRALEARASHLRQGIPCSIPPFNATSPPTALRVYIIRSEVATLMFLEKTCFEKTPFNVVGSLDSPGESHVGASAQESCIDFVQSEMRTSGPFSSLEEHYTCSRSIQLILNPIVQEEMYSQDAVDAYLIHRYLIDLVPRVYLQHTDDKGDHILMDEHFNITGIIDWEWAYTASPAHAFHSPIGFYQLQTFTAVATTCAMMRLFLHNCLRKGVHRFLACFVRNGRLQHRFNFCCGVDKGLEWDEWKIGALQRYKDDPGLQLLFD
ncbi:hypothetical protein HDV63DRAFT_396552 [Trichoderma sp. SZMC 28014]